MDSESKRGRVATCCGIGMAMAVILSVLGAVVIKSALLVGSGFVLAAVTLLVSSHIYKDYATFEAFSGLTIAVGGVFFVLGFWIKDRLIWMSVLAGVGIAVGFFNLSTRNKPVA